MNRPPYFLSKEDVLTIHRRMIAEYGGVSSLRDAAMLESALASPRASFDGEFLNSTPLEQAAALLNGLCGNHPFTE